ncbi:MAG TPA: tripartite tricarboxylate transporter substrate binding protein [Burkholderiaceae bacterium]|nr:tripartite tricarboxylate transporter substrate binding protein [Burkholderiaceae bacterium]
MRKLFAALAIAIAAPLAHGQAADFPNKPIRIVVPFNAGSGADETSRVYGEIVSKMFGQPVNVENRPGASGTIAIQAVKSAPPDGHTILQASNSPMAVNLLTMKNLPYDPFKDFRPVHGLSVGPAAFVVKADSPYKSMKDLVEAARRENRPINIGNYSDGYKLIAAWLGTAGNVPVNHVTYKGGVQMVTDVIGGQIEIGVNDFGGVAQQAKQGRLRILAITGDKRDPMLPDVPTMIESGFPGFESYVWASLFVRADTPDAIVEKLADAFGKALVSPEGKAYQSQRPGQVLMMRTDEMGKFHRREYERFKRVAEAAGIQPQ